MHGGGRQLPRVRKPSASVRYHEKHNLRINALPTQVCIRQGRTATETQQRRAMTTPMNRHALLIVAAIGLACQPAVGQVARPLDPLAAKLEPTRTVVYRSVGERSLRLHLFEPDGHRPTDRRPVLLVIHGGGWTGGNPRRSYPIADRFARLGMVGASLEYRLLGSGPGTTVFDCVRDGRAAVRYLRRHAVALGIDPARIAVAGNSAGGHVAVGTALFDAVDEAADNATVACRPDALVLYYPVIDTSARGYGQQKIGDRWRALSPVDHVRPGLPPTILFHGTADTVTPYVGAMLFQTRMQTAGNHCELVSHPGGKHGYLIFDLDLFERAMERTEQFLKAQNIVELPSSTVESDPPNARQ